VLLALSGRDNLIMREKVWIAIIVIGVAGGVFFLTAGFSYLYSYFSEPDNPLRNESLQVVAISSMFSVPFWLVASGAIHKVRALVPRGILVVTNSITVLITVLCVAASIYPFAMMAMGK
jgi:hypothetical protein